MSLTEISGGASTGASMHFRRFQRGLKNFIGSQVSFMGVSVAFQGFSWRFRIFKKILCHLTEFHLSDCRLDECHLVETGMMNFSDPATLFFTSVQLQREGKIYDKILIVSTVIKPLNC